LNSHWTSKSARGKRKTVRSGPGSATDGAGARNRNTLELALAWPRLSTLALATSLPRPGPGSATDLRGRARRNTHDLALARPRLLESHRCLDWYVGIAPRRRRRATRKNPQDPVARLACAPDGDPAGGGCRKNTARKEKQKDEGGYPLDVYCLAALRNTRFGRGMCHAHRRMSHAMT